MIKWQDHIEQKPNVMYGKPVIKNTRVPVEIILKKLAQGERMEGILEAYPHISREAVDTCMFYATANPIFFRTEGG